MARPKKIRDIYNRLEFDDPCPEDHMLGKNTGRFICHVLRQIYQVTNDPEVRLRARIATTMARKMIVKLEEHGVGWADLYAMTKKE